MKEANYFYTDKTGKPRVCICVLQNDYGRARGIAICSKNDAVSEYLGRTKANGRAKKALYRQKSDLKINRDEAIRTLFNVESTPFQYKSEYEPRLTSMEKELLY